MLDFKSFGFLYRNYILAFQQAGIYIFWNHTVESRCMDHKINQTSFYLYLGWSWLLHHKNPGPHIGRGSGSSSGVDIIQIV